jgi:tetratricopeptide (TPR) repeat protein
LAGSLYDAGKYEEALEHYTKSIRLYSNTPSSLKTLYYWRGRSYRQLKKYTESLADFRSAMAIDSSHGGYNANAGDMAYNLALYTDAVRYYQRSIQAGDNDKKVMSTNKKSITRP